MVHSPAARNTLDLPEVLGPEASQTPERMFRDPRLFEKQERGELIAQLRNAVDIAPHMPEVRVLYGMALCVDLQAQEALEQMREAVRQAPDSFIARLQFGELLMRLRICDQAAEHTQKAAELACNGVQSDLARRQAATIRTMRREGVEQGGYSWASRRGGFHLRPSWSHHKLNRPGNHLRAR
jgi:tetratricopeptide (TPR) repeat protein